MRALGRGLLSLLIAVVAAGCHSSDGTYAVVDFHGSVPAGKAIHSIEVQLQLGTHTDSALFTAGAGKTIPLPTTATLDIRSGQGDLTAVAIARAEDGSPIARGSGACRVASGKTCILEIVFAPSSIDAGADAGDGGTDGGLAGVDLGSGDASALGDASAGGRVGAGGAGGAIVPGSGGVRGVDGGGGRGGSSSTSTGGAGGGPLSGAGGVLGTDAAGTGGSDAPAMGGVLGTDAAPADDSAAFVLSLSSTTVDLGLTPVGGVSSPRTLAVTNMGSAISLPLTVFVSDRHHFPLAQDGCSGVSLRPGSSCTLVFTFNPDTVVPVQTDGAVSAGSQTARFILKGSGLSAPSTLNLSPQAVDFLTVDIGIPSPVTFTVTNHGSTDSGVLRVSASPTSAFQITNDLCAKTTLAQLGQCTFTLVFAPRSLGPVSGTVLVESASASATSTATGTGVDHVQLTIQFAGTGGGSVTGPNVDCRSAALSCNLGVMRTDPTSFPTISLSELPDTLSVFAGWGGACTGTGNCNVVMDASKTVTATFNTQQLKKLLP